MSDMSIQANKGAAYTQTVETSGTLPQIIDVKTGMGTDRAGLRVTTRTDGVGDVSGVDAALLPSQVQDLEALLAILGLDGENAKQATTLSVLKAIQSSIRQQSVIFTEKTTETTTVSAMSDYDVERLKALKKAVEESNDPDAAKIVENIDRMQVLKDEIEDLANNKGLTYDGKFETVSPNPNFELNTRVREMGDRIADIRHFSARLGESGTDALLDKLAPAMKTAVKDLLAAYAKTSGWGVQVNISYSTDVLVTVKSFASVLASTDLQLPAQISKDALSQVLKNVAEDLAEDADVAQVLAKLEEKLEEIIAQLNEVAANMPVKA